MRSKEKESDELLYTVRSLVMVRNQLSAQVVQNVEEPRKPSAFLDLETGIITNKLKNRRYLTNVKLSIFQS